MAEWWLLAFAAGLILLGFVAARRLARMEVDRQHHDEELRVWEIAEGNGIEGRLFTGCTIVGPAVLVIGGDFTLNHNVIEGDADAFLWPVERERVVGGFLVKDCAFKGCTFRHVGFAGHPDVIERIRDTIRGEA